jgi:recombination protein RecT
MGNELSIYKRTQDLLKSEDVKARFNEIMGNERSYAFLASVLSVVYQSRDLQECEPTSVLYSAMKAAILDLPVDPNIGQSAIIPYKGKATFQIMYKGIIRLALRSKEYQDINADLVYEGEMVKKDRLTGRITINNGKTSDKIIGAFAYFKLKDGFDKFLYMTVEELEAHGVRYSPSYHHDKSLWQTNKPAMYKKTVLKLLLTQYGPLSVDVKRVLAEDENPAGDENTVAGEVTEVEADQEEKPKRGRKPRAEVDNPPQNTPTEQQASPETPAEEKTIVDIPQEENAAQSILAEIDDPVVKQYGERYWIDHKPFWKYSVAELTELKAKLNNQLKDEKENRMQMQLISALDAINVVRNYRMAQRVDE